MAFAKTSIFILLGYLLQSFVVINARPSDCGCGSAGFGGGLGGGYSGGYGGGFGGGCGLPVPISPPISFAPVPQPFPIKVPSAHHCGAPPQSVTIPNIILALLPPTSKPAPVARPPPFIPPFIPRPPPIVLPIPQPYPIQVPDCGAPPPCGC